MRVLQLHNRHGSRGGADEVMDLERDVLREVGHDVDQLTYGPADGATSVRDGVRAVWNTDMTRLLEDRLREFGPDVVHVHTPFPLMSPAVFRTARRHGCATVATCHSFRYSCIGGTLLRDGVICEDCVGKRLKLPGLRHGCYHGSRVASLPMTTSLAVHRAIGTFHRDVDRFVTLTAFTRDLLIRDGLPSSRIVVKPNAVPDPRTPRRPQPKPAFVGFVGRLVDEKGIRTLLDAWRTVDGVRLTIAGDGPLRPLVEARAAQDPTITFEGWVDDARVGAIMADAILTIVPSEWYEAAPPLTLLRSLAAGTPVVCSDLENICSSVVASRAGRTFRTGNAASLGATISGAVGDPYWLASAAVGARSLYLRQHTPEATLKALESIYADAIIGSRLR